MTDQLALFPTIDPTEAPAGYYAVPKSTPDGSNICRGCDWRPTCQREDTDFTAPGHRCMEFAIETPDGRTIQRRDGCSVMFRQEARA